MGIRWFTCYLLCHLKCAKWSGTENDHSVILYVYSLEPILMPGMTCALNWPGQQIDLYLWETHANQAVYFTSRNWLRSPSDVRIYDKSIYMTQNQIMFGTVWKGTIKWAWTPNSAYLHMTENEHCPSCGFGYWRVSHPVLKSAWFNCV